MSGDLVTIVVPVYNVEQYLRECVDSILAQTHRNLQVVLVNDGSLDSSPDICDEYQKEDSRIEVVHKDNGGLSDARNVGLRRAKGEWIAFVDSDDWVEPSFIERLLGAAISESADISVCAYVKVYENGRREVVDTPTATKAMTNIEAMRDLFTYKLYGGVMTWNKLYRTSIFQRSDIDFPTGRVHEDNFTTYKTYYYANRVFYINAPLLYYRQRDSSIMGSKFSEKRLDGVAAADEASLFVKDNQLPLKDEARFNALAARMSALYSLQISPNAKKFSEIETHLLKEIVGMRRQLLTNKYLRPRDRVRIFSASFPVFYRLLNKMRSGHV